MKLSQVAAQFWTVRQFTQTPADLALTAQKVRAIGYEAVQLSGHGPIPDDEVGRIMREAGLTICATHEPADEILNQPRRCIERLQRFGCTLTAYPFPAGVDFASEEDVTQLVRRLDAAGAAFHAAGLALGYHNHGIEFVRFHGRPVLEYIYAKTDPKHLVGELDTYWIQYGGGDCVDWCRRLRGRMPFIHLKDYTFSAETKQPMFCEIGQGTLPFERIIPEAEKSGCQWFIVEQDTCPGDPFDSLRMSFEYIRAHLLDLPVA